MAPKIFVLSGLPGVGKTFIANQISKKANAKVLNTDQIRKELFPNPTYSSEESSKTYNELYSRAEKYLSSGQSVVLDATFTLQVGRKRVEQLADKNSVQVQFIRVTCDEQTTKRRIRERTDSHSDADTEVYELLKKSAEPFEREYIEIDNSGSKSNTISQLETKVV